MFSAKNSPKVTAFSVESFKRGDTIGVGTNPPLKSAFEGALLLLYGRDNAAVDAMMCLMNGSEGLVPTVDSTLTDFTCEPLINHYLCSG